MRLKSFKAKLITSVVGMALFQSTGAFAASLTSLEKLPVNNSPASSFNRLSIQPAPVIVANQLNLKALAKEDKSNENKPMPYRFAIPLDTNVDYAKAGQWETQGDTAIWRMKVTSQEALSLNFGLKNVFLPKGAKIFFYNDDYSTVLGPYTDKDNKSHGEIWTPIIESKSITMEINVPVKLKSFLKFDIARINQGYRGISSSAIAKSDSCNNDVVCSEADEWRNEIRSVARYSIDGAGLCTGTLMNNAKGDNKPYFLSAGHCSVSDTNDSTLVFYWNYETSICQGSPDGQLNQFTNGSTFRAASSVGGIVESDFVIVELDSLPDSAFNVYFSGWDRTSPAPSSAVAIHHPSGDEKRISFDYDPLTITTYSSNTIDSNGTHLRVGEWEDGTTEPGSSGSGIWNAAHRLVGTLSGGAASCSAMSASDWYGRMATHWEGGGSAVSQLKVWLDPDNSGAETVDGINSCTAPTVSITLSPSTAVIGEQLSFSASADGGSGGYTFEWDFNNDGIIDAIGSESSYVYQFLYQGNVRVTVNDTSNCPDSDSAAIIITNNGDEIFPPAEQIPSDWNVTSGVNAGWVLDSSSAFEGTSSLKSSPIQDSQTASIEVTQEFTGTDNFVSFAYKTSTEAGYDKLIFYVDDLEQGSWSGIFDWNTVYFPLSEGVHTLRWSYVKDLNTIEGSDTVWIDGVTGISFPDDDFTPLPTPTNNSGGGGSIGFSLVGVLLLLQNRKKLFCKL